MKAKTLERKKIQSNDSEERPNIKDDLVSWTRRKGRWDYMGIEWDEDTVEGQSLVNLGWLLDCVCEFVSVSVVCNDGKLSLFLRLYLYLYYTLLQWCYHTQIFSISQSIVHNWPINWTYIWSAQVLALFSTCNAFPFEEKEGIKKWDCNFAVGYLHITYGILHHVSFQQQHHTPHCTMHFLHTLYFMTLTIFWLVYFFTLENLFLFFTEKGLHG